MVRWWPRLIGWFIAKYVLLLIALILLFLSPAVVFLIAMLPLVYGRVIGITAGYALLASVVLGGAAWALAIEPHVQPMLLGAVKALMSTIDERDVAMSKEGVERRARRPS